MADDILSSVGLSQDDKKNYDTIVQRFEHFVKKTNSIFKRTKFNQRKQEEGESVDDFVTTLSEHSQYGELRGKMIHDRIVIGICNLSLSKKL